MSLRFASATTDKVTVPNPQTFGAGSEFSWFMWIKFTSSPLANQGFAKGGAEFVYSGPQWYWGIPRVTSAALAWPNSAYSNGVWYFIAGTYSEGDGARTFRGELGIPVTEDSYSSRPLGAGNTNADSSDLFIPNKTAISSQAVACDVETFAWFNRRLTLAELTIQQFAPMPDVGCTFFSHLGLTGVEARDWSGNARTGQVTGATLSDPINMRMPMPDERRIPTIQPVLV